MTRSRSTLPQAHLMLKHSLLRRFLSPLVLIKTAACIPSLLATLYFCYCATTVPNPFVSKTNALLAAIWSAVTASRTWYITDISLRRRYTLPLFAVAFLLYQALHYLFGAEKPVQLWLALACTSELLYLSLNLKFGKAQKVDSIISPLYSEPPMLETSVSWPFIIAGLVTVSVFFLLAEPTEPPVYARGTNVSLAELGASDKANMKLLLVILSSWTQDGYEKRQMFRESTLRLRPHISDQATIAYRFILGRVPSTKTKTEMGPKIVEEHLTYNDTIMIPSSDRYEDLSYKVDGTLKWANQFDFDYLIKTDDDMFVRLDTIAKELIEMPKARWYWRGLAHWNMPPNRNAEDKNAELEYPLPMLPTYVAGALYILSRDIVKAIATETPRIFTRNEDQNMGIWLFAYGIKPVHDRRIQQKDACEDDMIAKHFSDDFPEKLTMKDMYLNVKNGRRLCEGFRQYYCTICYPCEGRGTNWHDWGWDCDVQKGITLSDGARKAYSTSPSSSLGDSVMEIDFSVPIVETADDWIIPGLLSTTTSVLSLTENWHLLHWVCWTTDASTWKDRHYRTLDLIFAHMPGAVVVVLSGSLPTDFFVNYEEQGYRIHLVPIDQQLLLERKWHVGPNTKNWVNDWKKWESGPSFFSHLTDYLRFIVLYKYGGVYMDMDMLWLRAPPSSNEEFVGGDYSEVESDKSWTLDDRKLYIEPAVMRFRKGWRAFREIPERAFSPSYSPECFNCVGPRAITIYVKEHRKNLERHGFKILERDIFYPVSYLHVSRLLKANPEGLEEAKNEFKKLAMGSWGIHLYGYMTNGLAIEPGSVVNLISQHFHLGIPTTTIPSPALTLQAPETVRLAPQSHFKKFDGLDLIFLRGGPSTSYGNETTVLVKVNRGKLSWGLDAEASNAAAVYSDQEKNPMYSMVTMGMPYGTMTKFRKDEISLEGGVTKAVVNNLLSTLVYYPSSPTAEDGQTDVISLTIAFGGQKVVGLVGIDNS